MKRIKCSIAYDGTNFNGYQIQPRQRTVQGEIESALTKIHKGHEVRIHSSGRTDSGVHAYGQVFHFDTPLVIQSDRWKVALNTVLPGDIVVHQVNQVNEDFHARFDVVSKEYRYRIFRQNDPDVFLKNYTFHFPYPLNVAEMEVAKDYLIGTHDFTSFCSAKTDKKDRIRTITTIELQHKDNELIFRFVGNGFLYNMVRIIVGTLLTVGQGKMSAKDIKHILESKERRNAGRTVPGHGLYLWKVSYE